jgi:hypothetical protein
VTVSGNFMTTSQYIRTTLKDFSPTSQKINLTNANIGISTRVFKAKDHNGNKFKAFDFSERIMLEVAAKTSLLFAINLPNYIFSATNLQAPNIYIKHPKDKNVLSCVDFIKQEIKDINLRNNEAIFVYANAIQLLLDNSRGLIKEIKLLQQIKLIIEHNFPGSIDIIDTSKIPKDFKNLLPFIKEWAISDDQERSDKIRRTSKAKLQKLRDAIGPKLNLIDKYLDTFKNKSMHYEATLIGDLGVLGAELNLKGKVHSENYR